MIFKKSKVISALQKKGFEIDTGKHHVTLTYITLNGNTTNIQTRVSHGNKKKDLDNYLLGEMARQVNLKRRDFERFISCQIKQAEYEEKIGSTN